MTYTSNKRVAPPVKGRVRVGFDSPDTVYQWFRCDANGENCVPIPGATDPSGYTFTKEDVGCVLKVKPVTETAQW